MTRDDLGLHTARSFNNRIIGFFEFEQDKTTADEILKRYQTGLLMNASGNYGKRGVNIQKIWKIPSIDKVEKKVITTQKEMKKSVDKYSKIFKDE